VARELAKALDATCDEIIMGDARDRVSGAPYHERREPRSVHCAARKALMKPKCPLPRSAFFDVALTLL
jgi:hypothetical protein